MRPKTLLLSTLTLWLSTLAAALAGPTAPPRWQLAYPDKVNGPLADEVNALLDPGARPVPDAELVPGAYFLRILQEKYVLDGNGLKQDAVLGPRPFAFLTCPAAARHKTLLTLFSDIGYSADQVLDSRIGQPMVAVVFRYPDAVRLHEACESVPREGWRQRVYPATWVNAAGLLERLAAEAVVDRDPDRQVSFDRLLIAGERERSFLRGFPESGLKRIATCPYAVLRETGGADWEYRSLLERRLGASEHFSGKGRTKPAIGRQDGRLGLPEWLGPNARLKDLPEVAVIRLGALEVAR